MQVVSAMLVVATGFSLRKGFIRKISFWQLLDDLVFYVFFPALLVFELIDADLSSLNFSPGMEVVFFFSAAVCLMVYFIKRFFKLEEKKFVSLFHSGLRYNAYVFISTSSMLFGSNGIAIASVFVAGIILFSNVFMTVVRYRHLSFVLMAKKNCFAVIKNPLVLAVSLGFLIRGADFEIPIFLSIYLNYMGSAALPLCLISIGAGLVFTTRAK